jgi:hypothetical protein
VKLDRWRGETQLVGTLIELRERTPQARRSVVLQRRVAFCIWVQLIELAQPLAQLDESLRLRRIVEGSLRVLPLLLEPGGIWRKRIGQAQLGRVRLQPTELHIQVPHSA